MKLESLLRLVRLVGLIGLVGCQDAQVVTADGKSYTYCNTYDWAKCTAAACPNGYDVVHDGSTAVLMCKPACLVAPGVQRLP
jgi:hypothetical protein